MLPGFRFECALASVYVLVVFVCGCFVVKVVVVRSGIVRVFCGRLLHFPGMEPGCPCCCSSQSHYMFPGILERTLATFPVTRV